MPISSQIYRVDKNKIQKLRIDKNLTLLELANALGVEQQTICVFENKRNHIPSTELIIRYCEYFKIPVIEILVKEEQRLMAIRMADFFLKHEIIDHGTANSLINYYS